MKKKEIWQIEAELARRSAVTRWLINMSFTWGIIAGAMIVALTLHHWLAYFLAVLLIGTRQHAIAILGHDGAHFSICRNATMNDFLTAFLAFWPMGISLSGYRVFHFAHHAYLGTLRDPELRYKVLRAPQWDTPISRSRLAVYTVKDLCGLSAMEVVRIIQLTAPSRLRTMALPLAFVLACNAVLVWVGLYVAIALWYCALFTSFWAVFRLRAWIEHQGSEVTSRVRVSMWQRWIYAPMNSWCHWEHHRWPTVPFYALPRMRLQLYGQRIVTMGEILKRNLKTDEQTRISVAVPSGGSE